MQRARIIRMISLFPLALVLAISFRLALAKTARRMAVKIGGGYTTGVSYQSADAIEKIINKKSKALGLQCKVVPTTGSVANVEKVVTGTVQFAYVRSDVQFQAWNGTDEWSERGAQKNLRSVFAVYPEDLTLIAAEGSGIKRIEDLRGKRVNTGVVGSGLYQVSLAALIAVGIDYDKDIKMSHFPENGAPDLLQQEKFDAYFYMVGHPNMNVTEAIAGKIKKVRICEVAGPGIDMMLRDKPYYVRTVIPMRFYPKAVNMGDVLTFGVKASLVTSAAVPDAVVYRLTKEIFTNLDEFKKLVPAQWQLTKKNMLESLTAPIHPGARQYYKEAGLM
jgi:TRAP transporter TAXI family solute receptor